MKQRPASVPKKDTDAGFKALAKALASLQDPAEVAAFLRDLCTPAELEAMTDRWWISR